MLHLELYLFVQFIQKIFLWRLVTLWITINISVSIFSFGFRYAEADLLYPVFIQFDVFHNFLRIEFIYKGEEKQLTKKIDN
jgi:hypothetical protein